MKWNHTSVISLPQKSYGKWGRPCRQRSVVSGVYKILWWRTRSSSAFYPDRRPSPLKGFWPQSDLVRQVGAAPTIHRVPPIWTAKHSVHATRPVKPYKCLAELFNFPIFYINYLRPGLKPNRQVARLPDTSAVCLPHAVCLRSISGIYWQVILPQNCPHGDFNMSAQTSMCHSYDQHCHLRT